MELDELKKVWDKVDEVAYNEEEINQVFEIRNKQTVYSLQRYLLKDTIWSVIIAAGFIGILFYFNFSTRLGWTIALTGMALFMVLMTSLQSHFLYRSLLFENNIVQSLKVTSSRLRKMKIYYLIWPTLLAGSLTILYLLDFGQAMSTVEQAIWVLGISGISMVVAYYLTTLTVSKYLKIITEYIEQLEEYEIG